MTAWVWMAVAAIACSTSVLFIKASTLPPLWLCASRLLIAAAVLSPLAMLAARRAPGSYGWSEARRSLLPAAALALHFIGWIIGARLCPAADGTLIANLLPLVLPIIAYAWLRERMTRAEAAACALAVSGAMAMAVAGGVAPGGGHAVGYALCGGAVVMLAVYLIAMRRARLPSLWLSVVPMYAMAGVIAAIAAVAIEGLPPALDARETLLMLGLALVPTVIGHTALNRALADLGPTVVGAASVSQCPLAAATAWLLWGETPGAGFWIAAVAVAIALVILVRVPRPAQVPLVAASRAA